MQPPIRLKFDVSYGVMIDLTVNFGGKEVSEEFLVDTGFIGDPSGLVLPLSYLPSGGNRFVTKISLPDKKTISVDYIPSGRVLNLEGNATDIELPVVFYGAKFMAGCKFVEKCIISINGPSHFCELSV